MAGTVSCFSSFRSGLLSLSDSFVVVVLDRILLTGDPSLERSKSWVTELSSLCCLSCFLLKDFNSRKIIMVATTKHKRKVTDTDIPTAAATLALAVPCSVAVVPTKEWKKKKKWSLFFVLIFSKLQEKCKIRTSKASTYIFISFFKTNKKSPKASRTRRCLQMARGTTPVFLI